MATVHFIQQGKGGVGKSMIASILYQVLRLLGKKGRCLRYRPGERDTGRIQGI